MNLEQYMNSMRPVIEAELQSFAGRAMASEYPELLSMLRYHMGWEGEGAGPEAQGKRIRPLLVLLCAEAAGGDWRRGLPAAVGVELLHNFSLVHDDIEDNSPLRHSRPTVWVKWGPAQAINLGDVMYTLSLLAIHDLSRSLPADDTLLANKILQETCLRLTEGQYLDMTYESVPVLPMEAYWPMIGGKTSALLACCCELGALAGGALPAAREQFREYGYSLGLAFQVLDDWLGIWGNSALTGKSAESDLVSGKKTLPVLYGLAKNGPFRQRWIQGSIRPEEVPGIARMLEEEGAYIDTLDTAARLTEQSLQALERATGADRNCAAGAALALHQLTGALLRRKN